MDSVIRLFYFIFFFLQFFFCTVLLYVLYVCTSDFCLFCLFIPLALRQIRKRNIELTLRYASTQIDLYNKDVQTYNTENGRRKLERIHETYQKDRNTKVSLYKEDSLF